MKHVHQVERKHLMEDMFCIRLFMKVIHTLVWPFRCIQNMWNKHQISYYGWSCYWYWFQDTWWKILRYFDVRTSSFGSGCFWLKFFLVQCTFHCQRLSFAYDGTTWQAEQQSPWRCACLSRMCIAGDWPLRKVNNSVIILSYFLNSYNSIQIVHLYTEKGAAVLLFIVLYFRYLT